MCGACRGNPDDKIHWFSITNSTMIVFFLAGMVAMILVRALHRDISRYATPSPCHCPFHTTNTRHLPSWNLGC